MPRFLVPAMAFALAVPAHAQSIFDLLAKTDLTEHWMVMPGKDSCGLAYRPADGSLIINRQPSFTVRKTGAFLSFSKQWANGADLAAGPHELAIGGTALAAEGEPWDAAGSGIRFYVPPDFVRILAKGGAMTVTRGGQTIIAFEFGADTGMLDQMQGCISALNR